MSARKFLGILWVCALALPLMSAQAQTVKYIHTDALGSVMAVTDENRNVIERREYEPYGAQLTPFVSDGPGYTGHVQDVATGLTYMQQRYYDPGVGRFLSVDPVTALDNGDMRHFNRYAYAYNNPYKFTDRDGRCPVCVGIFIYLVMNDAQAPAPGERTSTMPAGEQIASAIPGGGRLVAPAKIAIRASSGGKPLAGTDDRSGPKDSRHKTTGEGGLPGAVAQFKTDRKPGETLTVSGGRRANGEEVKVMGSQGTNLRVKEDGKVSVDSPDRGTKRTGETTHYDDEKRKP